MKNKSAEDLYKSASSTEVKSRKKSAQTFLQKNANLLQSYKVFGPPQRQIGDVNFLFKESLRQYDDFEIKCFKIASQKSLDRITKRRKPYIGIDANGSRNRTKVKLDNLSIESERSNQEDQDLEIFYSPTGDLVDDESKTLKSVKFNTNLTIIPHEETDVEDEVQRRTSSTTEDSGIREGLDAAEENDDLEAVDSLLQKAEDEIQNIVKDNELSLDETDSGTELFTKNDGEYKANAQSSVIKELEDAEQQALDTAKNMNELKERVAHLMNKTRMTQNEAKELQEKNEQLKEQMLRFEEKTNHIRCLVEQANFFENSSANQYDQRFEKSHDATVCEDKHSKTEADFDHGACNPYAKQGLLPPMEVVSELAKKLNESYCMQEKLAEENAGLEGKRYQLQEDLLSKDQTVESLQRRLNSLQAELRMVCKENTLLSDKLTKNETCPESCGPGEEPQTSSHTPRNLMHCGKSKGICPADVEARLEEYSQNTQQLEKQLCEMGNEVRLMQNELAAVQKERQHLEHHRRMMYNNVSNSNMCIPGCGQRQAAASPCCGGPPPMSFPNTCPADMNEGLNSQLRELREQYNRLQDDFKSKLTEVAGLRADVEKFKTAATSFEEAKKTAEDRVKEVEREMKKFKLENNKFVGSKEQLMEQEQQLTVAKHRFREAQDELEETRALIQDQHEQLDDYRNRYLQAQQTVEEQRREIDMMEIESNRISEEVNLEFMRVKNQFQEKLQELIPLPDLLKATQLKLQEAQQMHLLAEKNNEALAKELEMYKDKAEAIKNQMDQVRSDQQLGENEKETLAQQIKHWENKYNEMLEEFDKLKMELEHAENRAEQNDKRAKEKLHEIAQLESQLETVREESARQVARIKDRCETVRRSMQNQITDLERQLAQSRAQAKAAQKERDEVRHKMMVQINNLNENFEDAQMRIRNLQGHVNYLQNSYGNTTCPTSELHLLPSSDPCDCSVKF